MLGTVLSFVTVFWVRGGDWLSFTKKMEKIKSILSNYTSISFKNQFIKPFPNN